MGLHEVGSLGYQVGALGILVFTVSFLVTVRWWTDFLGRVLAFVFMGVSAVLVVSAYRTLANPDGHGFFIMRAVVYWTFAAGIWSGLVAFFWTQFFARRATRRERRNEEVGMADHRHNRYGSSDGRSGGHG